MICLVTDRRRLSAGSDALDRLVDLVAAAAHAGIDLIQIRERDLQARALTSLVSRCVDAVDGTRAKLLVNDRVDVAVAARSHGVHLRGDSIPTAAARSLLDAGAIVGRSVHSADESAAIARAGGVDYMIFGTLYETASKDAPHRLASLGELSCACRAAAGIPVLAIGGITVGRAIEVARAGAAGIAGVGLFIPPAGTSRDRHLQCVTDELRRAFDTCEAVS
jgi:thiamine-phosphate pyrophosphorylase